MVLPQQSPQTTNSPTRSPPTIVTVFVAAGQGNVARVTDVDGHTGDAEALGIKQLFGIVRVDQGAIVVFNQLKQRHVGVVPGAIGHKGQVRHTDGRQLVPVVAVQPLNAVPNVRFHPDRIRRGGGKSNFIGVVFRPKRFGKITRVGIGVGGHVQQPLVTGFGQQKIQRNGRVPLDEFDFSAVQGVDPVPKP